MSNILVSIEQTICLNVVLLLLSICEALFQVLKQKIKGVYKYLFVYHEALLLLQPALVILHLLLLHHQPLFHLSLAVVL